MPDGRAMPPTEDPAEVTESRETIRVAFIAALQHLPARQRAVLILREVLRWKASEVAELLDTSVVSVNSALQRARSTLAASNVADSDVRMPQDDEQRALLARYVDAFERFDIEALVSLLHEDATMSMPPYELWLRRRRRAPQVAARRRFRLPRARGSSPSRRTGRPRSPSGAPVVPAAASRRGRSTSSACQTDGSAGSTSSSILTCFRCSGCRCGSGEQAGHTGSSSRSPVKARRSRSSARALRSRIARPDRRAVSWRRAQRADRGDVGVHEPPDLARDEIDVAVGEEQPEALAEIGDGGAGNRSTDVEDDRPRPGRGPQTFERRGGQRVGRGQENLLGEPFPHYDHERARNSPAPTPGLTSDLEDDDVGRARLGLEVGVGGACGSGISVAGRHLLARGFASFPGRRS